MFYCPVCLKKLVYAIGFDPVKRYSDMIEVCEKNGFEEDKVWAEKRKLDIETTLKKLK